MSTIEIIPGVEISESELSFRFSRSSGPGGQNVNKLNTRVTLFFDVANCATLTDDQKGRILEKLSTRADKAGVVRVVCQKFRTQNANRQAAVERLAELLAKVLEKKPVRKKTAAPYAAKERRLSAKKERGALKAQRQMGHRGED